MPQGFDTWLTPEWLAIEEACWAMSIIKNEGAWQNAKQINNTILHFGGVNTIVEFGCGTGWIPWLLRRAGHSGKYYGVDNNQSCLNVARHRCPNDHWEKLNIREMPGITGYDLACTFSMMKHIPLEDWQRIWVKIQMAAPIVVASLNMSHTALPVDDSGEYFHNWVPESWIFDGSKRVHYMRKNWEGEQGSDITVVLVDEERIRGSRQA